MTTTVTTMQNMLHLMQTLIETASTRQLTWKPTSDCSESTKTRMMTKKKTRNDDEYMSDAKES
jgi:hypothetical protein